MNFSRTDKIGEVAWRSEEIHRAFHRLGIHPCHCSADATLEEVAASAGIALQDLLTALEQAASSPPPC